MNQETAVAIIGALGVIIGTAISSIVSYLVNRTRTGAQNRLDDSLGLRNIGATYDELVDNLLSRISNQESQLKEAAAQALTLTDEKRQALIDNAALKQGLDQLQLEKELWDAQREEWKVGITKLLNQIENDLHLKPVWKPKATGPFKL